MDPIANMFTILENATRVKRETVVVPKSSIKVAILECLKKLDRIKDFTVSSDSKPTITIHLADKFYKFRRISKPSRRLYASVTQLPTTTPYKLVLVSTSQGVMTTKQAKKLKLGGELIVEVALK